MISDSETRRATVAVESRGEDVRRTPDERAECAIENMLLDTQYRVSVSGYCALASTLVDNLQPRDSFPIFDPRPCNSISGRRLVGTTAAATSQSRICFVPVTELVSHEWAAYEHRQGTPLERQ